MTNTPIAIPPDADPEFQRFVALSAHLGADRMLVQTAGGNTSLKQGDTLWVKASGKTLARATQEPIFVPLDLPAVRAAVARGEADPAKGRVRGQTPLRPSIETTLHALLPHRVVLHVHSVNTLAWTTRADGRERAAERLTGLPWAWVSYRRPGLPLTRGVQEVAGPATAILVLGNHGLVVGGVDCAGAEALLWEVERRLVLSPRPAPAPDPQVLADAARTTGYRLPAFPDAHALATDPVTFPRARRGVLYPDHVVFLKPVPAVVERGQDPAAALAGCRAEQGVSPSHLLVEGAGILVAPETTAAGEEMLRCQADVLARVPPEADLRYLAPEEVAELLTWDAEKFRRALSAERPPAQ